MASFNRVILLGNVTRDPELKYVSTGTAVAEIGLAVNDRRKTASGEWVDETTFVDVTLWGRTAEVACEYASKGSPILIEGRLKLDTWEKDGRKNSKLRWSAKNSNCSARAAAAVMAPAVLASRVWQPESLPLAAKILIPCPSMMVPTPAVGR